MDEKEFKPIDRFERTPEGWLYFRLHPFTIYVWHYYEFGEVEPSGYEVVLHFGNSTKVHHGSHDNIFPTEELACSFAISKATELSIKLLKELERKE